MTMPNQAQDVSRYHQNSDIDSSSLAQHHTLGTQSNQAVAGDHTHNGRNSRLVSNADISNHVNYGSGTCNITVFQGNYVAVVVYPALLLSLGELFIIPYATVVTISYANSLIIEGIDTSSNFVLGSVGAPRLPRCADGLTYPTGTQVNWRWVSV